MAQKTAVEWLVSQQKHGKFFFDEIIEQAKAMEKEQIMKAYNDGAKDAVDINYKGVSEYYNETYNK